MSLLVRLAGLLGLCAGLACFRAIPAVVRWMYEDGAAGGTAAGLGTFAVTAIAVALLLMAGPPLLLGGLFAALYGGRPKPR